MLDVAEALFMNHGYATIKLKHIATALDIKIASLYYHFPGGKEELYVAVMRRSLEHHRYGIIAAIRAAGDDWVAQLQAVAHWLLANPPLNMMQLNQSDLPTIDPAAAQHITEAAYEALHLPIANIFETAAARGQANIPASDLLAAAFISLISAVHLIKSDQHATAKPKMATILIQTWVTGLATPQDFVPNSPAE